MANLKIMMTTAMVATLLLTGLPRADADEAAKVDAEPGKTSVTLVNPGDEPRRKLRFEFNADSKEQLDVTMKMGMSMLMQGQAMPKQEMPPIIQSIEIEPINVENGTMNYRFTLSKMKVAAEGGNPMIAAQMKKAVEGVVGLTGTGTIDSRGFSEGIEIEAPEDPSTMLVQQIKGFRDTMSRIVSPLPEEAVGVGAEWKVGMPIMMNGVTMTGSHTYTIVSMDEDSVKTNVVTTMTAKDQAINDPNLPPGAKVNINQIQGDGEGTTEFRLKSMCAVTELTAKILQDATISMEGAPGQNMGMEINMKMNIAPGKLGGDEDAAAEEEGAEEKVAEPVAN